MGLDDLVGTVVDSASTSKYVKKFNIVKVYFGCILLCSILLFFYVMMYADMLQSLIFCELIPDGIVIKIFPEFIDEYNFFTYIAAYILMLFLTIILLFLISAIIISVYRIAYWLIVDEDNFDKH